MKFYILLILILIFLFINKNNIEPFQNNLMWDQIYLLNIPRLKERRDYMLNEFKNNNLKVNTHYGVDKHDINEQFLQNLLKKGKITQDYFNKSKNSKKGTLACLLTHVGLWEKLKESKYDHFLIFEDDCHILPNFSEKAHKYLQEVPDDWDMIWLGHGRLKGKKITPNVLVPENNPGEGLNALHHCYMIKKSSVDKFLNFIYPLDTHISKDSIIRKNFDKFNAYFIVESLAQQDRVKFRVSDRQK